MMKMNIFITAILIMVVFSAGCGIGGKNTASAKNTDKAAVSTKNTDKAAVSTKSPEDTAGSVRESEESDSDLEEEDSPYQDMHLKLAVTDPGSDIYSPGKKGSASYRYGASMLLDKDGGIDVYMAAPGDSNRELDWITYMHSDDGGKTWSDEKVVLSPTPCSRDEHSVCDPDVFYYDGYYYIGYTSTMDITNQGIMNSVFLARSKNPDGPFVKWGGKSWGGDPEPIIYYDGLWQAWGAGEPSFVVVGDTVYVYSTRDGYDSNNVRIKTTEVHTADITRRNWPAELKFAGYAVVRTDTNKLLEPDADYVYEDSDSWDVAYLEEYEKFVAISTNRRFKRNSSILYYESNDGLYFERVSELNTNVCCGSHNAGIMADGSGHVKKGDPMRIGYAYSGLGNSSWGTWALRMAPLSADITSEIDRSEEQAENLKIGISYGNSGKGTEPFFITADSRVKSMKMGGGSFNIAYAWLDGSRVSHALDPSEVELSGYSGRIVRVKGSEIYPVGKGMTSITISYKGVSRQIRLCVYGAEEAIPSSGGSTVTELVSPVRRYTVSLSKPYGVTVRPIAVRNDHSIEEVSYFTVASGGVAYESLNESVCTVRIDGLIVPVSPGTARVRVTYYGNLSYLADVKVVE